VTAKPPSTAAKATAARRSRRPAITLGVDTFVAGPVIRKVIPAPGGRPRRGGPPRPASPRRRRPRWGIRSRQREGRPLARRDRSIGSTTLRGTSKQARGRGRPTRGPGRSPDRGRTSVGGSR